MALQQIQKEMPVASAMKVAEEKQTKIVDTGMAASHKQLMVVSCYTRFDNLAHGPKGTEAKQSLYTFALDAHDGQMTLVSTTEEPVMNPAFMRYHPEKNMVYSCTESVAEDGKLTSWSVCPKTGSLSPVAECSAGGTSTCYITLDRNAENALVVNYWDSTIGVFGIDRMSGAISGLKSMYDPKEGKAMVATHNKHVNHSENDSSAQLERQSDPHSHAVVLDPNFGRIAYVPDLGMDVIRQFLYDPAEGRLVPAGTVHSGLVGRRALGPRYIEFHPFLPVCYVINELSSEVAVFEFDVGAATSLIEGGASAVSGAAPTLRLRQVVRTIPKAFPNKMNTCGRIAVHPAGNFVLVSNRGHDSISVFRVHQSLTEPGLLSLVCVQHTGGCTPRHFQFDGSGQWLVAANQDSDSLVVMRLNLGTGKLVQTGNYYDVPSPNFVCSVVPHAQVKKLSLAPPRAKL